MEKVPYFVRAWSVVIAIEQSNTSHIATMLQYINTIQYPAVINEQLCLLLYAVDMSENICWGTGLYMRVVFHTLLNISGVNSKKIRWSEIFLVRLKELKHWKMCQFQRSSHWIFMLRTSRASHSMCIYASWWCGYVTIRANNCLNLKQCFSENNIKLLDFWKKKSEMGRSNGSF